MKIFQWRALPLALLCAFGAPALADTPVSQGSKIAVPPPSILKYDEKSKQPQFPQQPTKVSGPVTVMRLPSQAGKVSSVLPGNFVEGAATSFIAKGDKHFSLCTPTKLNKVICTPVVAAATMTDIKVSAANTTSGMPLMLFAPSPTTKRTPDNIARAMNRFMGRMSTARLSLERHAISYAPKPWDQALQVGATASFADTGGGGGGVCTFDDSGTINCEGGEGSGASSGEGSSGGGGCYGACQYPTSGNNGDPEPGTDENGDPPIVVVITGQRPVQEQPVVVIPIPNYMPVEIQPAAWPTGCFPGPRGLWVCPVPGARPKPIPNPNEIPSLGGKRPWTNFDWCKAFDWGCPVTAQVPDIEAQVAAERARKVKICLTEAQASHEYCKRMNQFMGEPWAVNCVEEAIQQLNECLSLAEGSHGPNLTIGSTPAAIPKKEEM